MVFEIKPADGNKGTAIVAMMKEPALVRRRPVFIGDDLTETERARWRELLPTHPYARYLASRPTLTTRMTECVVPEDVWGSQVYEELLAPRGMRYQAAATLGSGPTTMTLRPE